MIRLENVSRRWPQFAVRDVTLDVETGEYLVIVGPTGAGKTLLLELLLGIHDPDEGVIFIDGVDVTSLPPERRGIAMVYQDYMLFPHLNVERNMAFGLRYRLGTSADKRRQVLTTAERLGIDHLLQRRVRTLSGGEKQRIAIGRALLTQPSVLLLDEPLNALDRRTADRLRDEIRSLNEGEGLTVLHVTHDLAEARQLGSRIALIQQGTLHGLGTADELLRRPSSLFAARFAGAVNLFPASEEVRNGGNCIVAGPIVATSEASDAGRPYLMIHPDEIVLVHDASHDSSTVVAGTVEGMFDEAHHVTLRLRVAGLTAPLTVYAPRQVIRSREIGLNSVVTADVRHAIHTFYE